uniref:Microtubule associated monoxygenase, calponin and LIM domain containing 1 n=2 Tax=Nothobranchius furzeri TaxID=105023 RepID=A0A1A8A2G8_NOTFU
MEIQSPVNPSHAVFELFVQAQTCQDVKQHFAELCRKLHVDPKNSRSLYSTIKERLNFWKAKALWAKLDKRASQELYQQGTACINNKCLVLGAGPCGLRTAIELALLGAQVVVLEKREKFSRNNVLHLWPFTIYDLRELGAKMFYGKFCSGSLDHISIPIDLENIVYYRDDTHYFVMTAKKKSLLERGVILQDFNDADQLLAPGNVDHVALCLYAHDAAYFSTGGQLPDLQFAQNHARKPDVAMFDFTCMHRSENASLVRERRGKKLLIALVGDCLVEPFWPLGTGIARGFLAAFDAAWMVRSWGMGVPHLKLLAERESIYQLLSQTTTDNTSKVYSKYSIDPKTRYQSVNLSSIQTHQVQHLYDADKSRPTSTRQKESGSRSRESRQPVLVVRLSCTEPAQQQTEQTVSTELADQGPARSCGRDFLLTAGSREPAGLPRPAKTLRFSRTQSAVLFLNKLKHSSLQRRKEKLVAENQAQEVKTMEASMPLVSPEDRPVPPPASVPEPIETGIEGNGELCYFCGQTMYVVERISAEAKFFHRSCFTCHHCGITLRLGGYTFDKNTGKFYCELHSEELLLPNGLKPSCEVNRNALLEIDEENESSSKNSTPSPSDDEYFLDSAPSLKQSLKHNEQARQIEEQSEEPQKSKTSTEAAAPTEEEVEEAMPCPVPKPRHSRESAPSFELSQPVAKPRTVLMKPNKPPSPVPGVEISKPDPDSRLKLSLRKLQLSNEEKNELGNLQSFGADSDSETPGGSSSCSSSSANAGGPPKQEGLDGQEEEGYWSGSTPSFLREKRNRLCFKRKEMPNGQPRARSKFSPWNLSSPRISRDSRLSVHVSRPESVETAFRDIHSTSEDGVDEDDDEDDMFASDDSDVFDRQFQTVPSDPVEAEKQELKRMKTLARRAKMSELQRFRKAQSIQRRLEEIEVSFKDLEEKGVVLERHLRGEAANSSSPDTIEQWIQLVHEKNALVSEESDLMVASRQLELEDKHSTLNLEYRKYMELKDKTPEQQSEEDRLFQEIIEVVEMRDSLVTFLEEKRLKEISEKEEAFSIMEAKRQSLAEYQVQWA